MDRHLELDPLILNHDSDSLMIANYSPQRVRGDEEESHGRGEDVEVLPV